MKKPKKCRHKWHETMRRGNFWAGGLTIMEECAKCKDAQLRPASIDEVETAQLNYVCPICKENHRPTNPLHEGCISTLVARVHALEETLEDFKKGLEK